MGPFKVEEVINDVAIRLKLPTTWRLHPGIHASHLTPWQDGSKNYPNTRELPPHDPETKCNGLTDLAKRVQPTPAADAPLAPSYPFEGAGDLHPNPFGSSRLAPASNCNLLLQ